MFAGKSDVLALGMLITLSLTIETGTAFFVSNPNMNINIKFWKNEIYRSHTFPENFECHIIPNDEMDSALSSIEIPTSPAFAKCMILFHGNCTGKRLKVSGTNINLEDYRTPNNTDFFDGKISTYMFCDVHRLKNQSTRKWHTSSTVVSTSTSNPNPEITAT